MIIYFEKDINFVYEKTWWLIFILLLTLSLYIKAMTKIITINPQRITKLPNSIYQEY